MGATTTAAGMPRVGLGTAVQGPKPESVRHAVLRGIERYLHFDTAAHYETEAPIGEAAAEAVRSGAVASSDELFITSKLWCSDAHGDRVLPALRVVIVKDLNLDIRKGIGFPDSSQFNSVGVDRGIKDNTLVSRKGHVLVTDRDGNEVLDEPTISNSQTALKAKFSAVHLQGLPFEAIQSGGPDNPAAADNSSLTPSKTHGDTAASPAPNLLDRCARTYNHAFYPANMGWSMQVHGSGWVDTSEIALKDEWKGYSPELEGVKWSGIYVTDNYLATLPPEIIGGGHLKKHIAVDWACYVSHKRRRAPSATASGATYHEIIDDPVWIYDSAASFSTTGNLALLQGFHDADPIVARVANGQTNYSDKCGHTSGAVNLYGIRYFPGAPNLISGGHLARLGCVATLNAQECIIKKDQLLVGYGRLHQDNIYHFNFLNGKLLGSICKCCLLP